MRRLPRGIFAMVLGIASLAPQAAPPAPNHPRASLAQLDGSSGVSVAFSADGRRLLTAGRRSARVWDAQTYRPLGRPLSFADEVRLAVIRPDGGAAAAASGTSAVIWESHAAEPLRVLNHPRPVLALAFRPDGKSVATGCADGVARVWDAATGNLLAEMKHAGPARHVTFSPDGTKVVTAAPAPRKGPTTEPPLDAEATTESEPMLRVMLWHAATGERAWPFESSWWNSTRAPPAFSPDGRLVATGNHAVHLLDAASGDRVARWSRIGVSCIVDTLQFSADGRTLLAAGEVFAYFPDDKEPAVYVPAAYVFHVEGATLAEKHRVLTTQHFDFAAAALDPTGSYAALASPARHESEDPGGVFEVTTDTRVLPFERRPTKVPRAERVDRALAFSPDGRRIALSYGNEGIGDRPTQTMVWAVPE